MGRPKAVCIYISLYFMIKTRGTLVVAAEGVLEIVYHCCLQWFIWLLYMYKLTAGRIFIFYIYIRFFTGNDPANEDHPNSLRLILRDSPGPTA